MINLEELQDIAFDTQEQYDIINAALDNAEDNGFLNAFVFERALICHEILHLNIDFDEDDPTTEEVNNNPLIAFDHYVAQGYVTQLSQEYKATADYMSKLAATYFEDYREYLLSLGGVINKSEIFSSQVLQNMAKQLQGVTENSEIKDVLNIANE